MLTLICLQGATKLIKKAVKSVCPALGVSEGAASEAGVTFPSPSVSVNFIICAFDTVIWYSLQY